MRVRGRGGMYYVRTRIRGRRKAEGGRRREEGRTGCIEVIAYVNRTMCTHGAIRIIAIAYVEERKYLG